MGKGKAEGSLKIPDSRVYLTEGLKRKNQVKQ